MSFLIFCNGMFVNKSRRVPPFTFFGTMRLLLKEIFFSKISIFFSKKSVLRFLSLRYGADLGRSRLVFPFFSSDYNLTLIGPLFLQSKLLKLLANEAKSGQRKLVQKGPPFIFYFFYRNLQNRTRLKGSIFFRHCATFFENFLMSQKSPPFEFFDILQQNIC